MCSRSRSKLFSLCRICRQDQSSLNASSELIQEVECSISSTQTDHRFFSDNSWIKKPAGADWHLESCESHDNACFPLGRSNAEAWTAKQRLLYYPPGPRNPVGIVWIGVNKKGIGIHGTDSPDTIGRSASHGCIRLANWDAARGS